MKIVIERGKGNQKDNLEVYQKQKKKEKKEKQTNKREIDLMVWHKKKAKDASEIFSSYDRAINDAAHLKLQYLSFMVGCLVFFLIQFYLFKFWDKGWRGTYSVGEDDLEFLISLPPPPEC